MIIDPTLMSSLILILVAFGAAFLTALWLSLLFWTWKDIRARTRDQHSQILALLVVLLLNLPGVLVYMILRPAYTLDEKYQRTLDEEALLASIEDQLLCPGCERRVHEDWQVCPSCHTILRRSCSQCARLMELTWKICPYCAAPALGMKIDTSSVAEAEPPSLPTS